MMENVFKKSLGVLRIKLLNGDFDRYDKHNAVRYGLDVDERFITVYGSGWKTVYPMSAVVYYSITEGA